MATGLHYNDDANVNYQIQLVHGSTNFTDSIMVFETPVGIPRYFDYNYWTVWEAVDGEEVFLQIDNDGGTGTGMHFAHGGIFVMEISEDLTENTDWFFNEDTADQNLSTTWEDGASVTFTPSNDNENWLVLTNSYIDVGSTNTLFKSRINAAGTITSTEQEEHIEAEDTNDFYVMSLMRIFELDNESNTFKEQGAMSSGTAGDRLNSKVFALNLEKFVDNEGFYNATEFDITCSGVDYACEIIADSITPTSQGDFFIFSTVTKDDAFGVQIRERMQVDGVDVMATQTADARIFIRGSDTIEENVLTKYAVKELTTGAKSLAVDGNFFSGDGTIVEDRAIGAFSMELAAAGDNCDPNCTENLSDGIIIGDSLIKEALFNQTDGIIIGDTVTLNHLDVQQTNQNDGIIIGDSIATFLADTTFQNDGIIIGDSVTLEITCNVTCQKNISDGIVIGDSLIKLALFNQTDGIIIGDSVTLTLLNIEQTNQNDGIIIGDTVTLTLICDVTCIITMSDGIIIGDVATPTGIAERTFNALVLRVNAAQNSTLGGSFSLLCPTNSTLTGLFENGTFRCTPMSDFFP